MIYHLCQIEIPVFDVERSLKFFESVLGWKKSPCELHGFIVLEVPEDITFGIALVPQTHASSSTKKIGSGVCPYFRVAGIDEYVGKIKRAGGTVLVAPNQIAGYGRVLRFSDLDNNRFGLFEDLK